jgi:hypothetical protein
VEETNCSALKVNYQMELGIPAQAKLLHSEIDVQQSRLSVVGLFCVCFMNDAQHCARSAVIAKFYVTQVHVVRSVNQEISGVKPPSAYTRAKAYGGIVILYYAQCIRMV